MISALSVIFLFMHIRAFLSVHVCVLREENSRTVPSIDAYKDARTNFVVVYVNNVL